MRTTLAALALALAACGRHDRPRTPPTASAAAPASTAALDRGPDQIALRFPRGGGVVHAYALPTLDSAIWSSAEHVPPLQELLSFDDEGGGGATATALSAKGSMVRVDIRLGSVETTYDPKLTHLVSSASGSAVFALAGPSTLARITPAERWTVTLPHEPRMLLPIPGGRILALADIGDSSVIVALRPPEKRITARLTIPRATTAITTQLGDRLYVAAGSRLLGIRTRALTVASTTRIGDRARALAATPSGDRVYVATDTAHALTVVDRYTGRIAGHVALPGRASALRMDPTGRYLITRAAAGDSAWIVAIANDRVIGSVITRWRSDLPTVAPNGSIAIVSGGAVQLVDGATLARQRTVAGGAKDLWLFATWNGFRPRAPLAPAPVLASDSAMAPPGSADTITPRDTLAITADSGTGDARLPPAPSPTPPARQRPARPAPPLIPSPATPVTAGFTVQFAALRSEAAATAQARSITVSGERARVVMTDRDGIAIYRVVLGPFSTRDSADRVGRASGKSYWVYAGPPQ